MESWRSFGSIGPIVLPQKKNRKGKKIMWRTEYDKNVGRIIESKGKKLIEIRKDLGFVHALELIT